MMPARANGFAGSRVLDTDNLQEDLGMLKKSAVAAALFFITVSSNVHALGLGALDMRSALNQPMNAVIDLTSASGTDLSKIKVSIASQQAHDRTGLSRARILTDFRFSVDRDSQGNAFIRVTSTDTIHEPFLEFLLELEWPSGRLLREYTVLVDPPVTMPARPAVPAAPVSRAPAPVAQRQVRQSRPAQPRPTMAPVRTTAAPAPAADSYGPVRRNETLWTIANRVRPGSDISVDQMMHALLRENPHAFMNNNINQLKAGATLRIPDREQIMSITTNEARAESNRQAREWKDGQGAPVPEPESEEIPLEVAVEAEGATESHLQLTAPEDDAIEGAATATASSGDPQAAEGESAAELDNQLALASEEAEASKAQSEELQTRVTELEQQIETMKRLLELKDDALADLQQQEASEAALDTATDTVEPEDTAIEMTEETDVIEIDEQPAEEAVEDVVVESETETATEPRGIVNKLMDNPVLAGLGVLVAILLGGFLWASTRRKGGQGIFDNEMTLEKHMANETAMKGKQQVPVVDFEEEAQEEEITPIQGHDESDPVTEADVYLAYGRIQQAEDVLQAALEKTPDDAELRVKLLEVYHASGNIAAFDREAGNFHDSVAGEGSQWLRVAAMGYALSPANELYGAGEGDKEKLGDLDFNMDLSGMDEPVESNDAVKDTDEEDLGLDLPESIEFNMEDVNEVLEDEEDASEGLLNNADEVATKLDLARAYMDMGDPEGARGILDEVMHEGNEEQKREAEDIISELA
jgi:pilus assembly protein FimV